MSFPCYIPCVYPSAKGEDHVPVQGRSLKMDIQTSGPDGDPTDSNIKDVNRN